MEFEEDEEVEREAGSSKSRVESFYAVIIEKGLPVYSSQWNQRFCPNFMDQSDFSILRLNFSMPRLCINAFMP